jgi:hypothetical protein
LRERLTPQRFLTLLHELRQAAARRALISDPPYVYRQPRSCNIELGRVKAAYDSKRGLLLTVPYTLHKGDGGRGTPGIVNVRINLSDNGSVMISGRSSRFRPLALVLNLKPTLALPIDNFKVSLVALC